MRVINHQYLQELGDNFLVLKRGLGEYTTASTPTAWTHSARPTTVTTIVAGESVAYD